MTTELEQEFYVTFGIEPKNKCGKDLVYPNCLNPECGYDNCIYYQIEYPEITAEKLLEMICIMNKHIHKHNENALCPIAGESYKEIKNYMLRLLNFSQPLLEKIDTIVKIC